MLTNRSRISGHPDIKYGTVASSGTRSYHGSLQSLGLVFYAILPPLPRYPEIEVTHSRILTSTFYTSNYDLRIASFFVSPLTIAVLAQLSIAQHDADSVYSCYYYTYYILASA
jgi:hypothetical protein